MSYDKQNWQTGDVITANKLNHIEDGIAGAGGGGGTSNLYITVSSQDGSMDKTWQEIADAITAGQMCWVVGGDIHDNGFNLQELIITISDQNSTYTLGSYNIVFSESTTYTAESANAYPVADD